MSANTDPDEANHEWLLRFLDGRVSPVERERVMQWLRSDPGARAFLREIAEQAVTVADLERTAQGRQMELLGRPSASSRPVADVVRPGFREWLRPMAAAAVILLLFTLLFRFIPTQEKGFVRVAKVTGFSQFFGSDGKMEHDLSGGALLGSGDTLETHSCDAWIELKLEDGATMTIAGNSTLRILDTESGRRRFKLLKGNLWVSPPVKPGGESVQIFTPAIVVETQSAQFDLQTSETTSIVRVNEGAVGIEQSLDGTTATVGRGQQVVASLRWKKALNVVAQPRPINFWSCNLGKVPEVRVGKWLPPDGIEQARLGADPLPWPVPGRDPVMLYAAALSVLSTTDRPVLLEAGSKLLIRGRTERAEQVRVGFSTQRMRGVFAGKFELDVQPESLGTPGETWEVELPLADFRAIQPHLSVSPVGLELKDIYALTIETDAGLEINHVELIPSVRTPP